MLTLGEHPILLFKVLQYAGHVGGAALAVWLLWVVGRDRRLVGWYPQGSVGLRASAASGVLLGCLLARRWMLGSELAPARADIGMKLNASGIRSTDP